MGAYLFILFLDCIYLNYHTQTHPIVTILRTYTHISAHCYIVYTFRHNKNPTNCCAWVWGRWGFCAIKTWRVIYAHSLASHSSLSRWIRKLASKQTHPHITHFTNPTCLPYRMKLRFTYIQTDKQTPLWAISISPQHNFPRHKWAPRSCSRSLTLFLSHSNSRIPMKSVHLFGIANFIRATHGIRGGNILNTFTHTHTHTKTSRTFLDKPYITINCVHMDGKPP